MRLLVRLVPLAILAVLASPPVGADDAPATRAAPKGVAIGDPVPSFDALDANGQTFSLASARTISADDARRAVLDAAKAAGKADATTESTIDAVLGTDAAVPGKRVAFVQGAWRAFGLIASESSVKAFVTLGDIATKIEASASAPIVFFAWSSVCPTIALYADRMLDWFSTTGARVFPFACTGDETLDTIRAAVKETSLPYRILVDFDGKLCDVLGARTTPHMFVLDEKNILRFNGAPDNDPALLVEESKRLPYLPDALKAVADGRSVEIRMTKPRGCPIRRKKP